MNFIKLHIEIKHILQDLEFRGQGKGHSQGQTSVFVNELENNRNEFDQIFQRGKS